MTSETSGVPDDAARPRELSFDVRRLAEEVRALQRKAARRILLGITGPPGAGKSTIAAELLGELGDSAVTVPMDGFHYSNAVLRSLGRESRKGAPDTFDVGGYLALLDRIRGNGPETIYGPSFDRRLDEPIAGDIPIPASVDVVLTEGNYLLTDLGDWRHVRSRLDRVWYVDVDPSLRLERLTARHGAFGKAPDAAEKWANGPDEANARIVMENRLEADLVIRLA